MIDSFISLLALIYLKFTQEHCLSRVLGGKFGKVGGERYDKT